MQKSVVRAWLMGLGLGMIVLWIVGLGTLSRVSLYFDNVSLIATRWVTWLTFAAAVCSFIGAFATDYHTSKKTIAAGTFALSLGVFAIWLIGLVDAALPMLTWWNFAFGCAYAIVGAAAGAITRTDEKGTDRFSRAA